jgi:hypothetical protein
MTMLILLGAALFALGALLFAAAVTAWLLGLAIRIAIRLFQLVLLIILANITFARWIRQRKTAVVLEGEVLPPQRALPDRSRVTPLLFAAMMVLAVSAAQADNWQDRAADAVAAPKAESEGFWVGPRLHLIIELNIFKTR